MTRKTCRISCAQKLREVSVLVARNVLKMVANLVLPCATVREKSELRGTRRAVPGAAVPSRWTAASGRSAAMPPSARSGQPQPLGTAQVRRVVQQREGDRGRPRLAKTASAQSHGKEAAWN